MNNASSGTHQINSDIAEVSKASNDASTSASQTLSAAKMLSQQAESLSTEINIFLDEVRHG
jgi:methyl-accepting chemotaxis protein